MNKIFTFIALFALTLTAGAKDFTDQLSISLGFGDPTVSESTVTVDKVVGVEGAYNITLNDFSFSSLKLGDIKVENVKSNYDEATGTTYFEETKVTLSIKLGIIPVSADVTINEGSCMKDDQLYLNMSIAAANMDITAIFGTIPSVTKSYTDNLVISLYGNTMPAQQATIDVTKQADGKYTLTLKNFEIPSLMAVGTIEMTDVDATEENGVVNLSTKQTVTIKEGESSDPDKVWMLAGQSVDVDMTGEMTDSKLTANIDITYVMDNFPMNINVKFGHDVSDGIDNAVTNSEVEAIYDINGNKLNSMKKGLNIIKKADGKTIKIMNK